MKLSLSDVRKMDLKIVNIGAYNADTGAVVVNSVCLSNGVGDGQFQIYACDRQPDGMTEIAWIDLRLVPCIYIWTYDCDSTSGVPYGTDVFYDAQGIGLGFDCDGNLYIWKQF